MLRFDFLALLGLNNYMAELVITAIAHMATAKKPQIMTPSAL